jgi:hypothetical protein
VVPRDLVRMDGLDVQIAERAFALPRLALGHDPWVLETPAVRELLVRLRNTGTSLKELIGSAPMYGIKTGLNEAYLVDTPTRDHMVASDPRCNELFKRLLRGHDVGRWDWDGLWLIALKSSGDHPWPWAKLSPPDAEARFRAELPSIYQHVMRYRAKLIAREDQGRFWWEMRPCAYYEAFDSPKIVYADIMWTAGFSRDVAGFYAPNSLYFLRPATRG